MSSPAVQVSTCAAALATVEADDAASGNAASGAPSRRAPAIILRSMTSPRLEGPHPDVAVLDGVAASVVLQSDVSAGELPQVGRRVTLARGLLAGRVVELVDHHAVTDDGVVLPDDADLVVVPLVLGGRVGVGQ